MNKGDWGGQILQWRLGDIARASGEPAGGGSLFYFPFPFVK